MFRRADSGETPPEHDVMLTVAEVARRLRVDNTTVRRWIKKGLLEAVVLPHKDARAGYRIRSSVLARLLAQGISSLPTTPPGTR